MVPSPFQYTLGVGASRIREGGEHPVPGPGDAVRPDRLDLGD
ncbi:hypothetical protein [Streptomyces sp. NRRL B-24572]|nr:hypothetical protein [Streptomyces sp. NRRL B-24572]